MRITHIDLAKHLSAAEEQLVLLVEALAGHGIEQHAIVRNSLLARRLEACMDVTLGPVVSSAVSAAFLIPGADLVHAHDKKSVVAGVLLSFMRDTPFVVSHRRFVPPHSNPATRWMYRRAAGIACPSADVAGPMIEYLRGKTVDTIGDARHPGNAFDSPESLVSPEKTAADYLRLYRRILDHRSVPAMLL